MFLTPEEFLKRKKRKELLLKISIPFVAVIIGTATTLLISLM